MKKFTLFDYATWPIEIGARTCAVYALYYLGKMYVGSSINLRTRLNWWRAAKYSLPKDTQVKIMRLCTEDERFAIEKALIKRYKTDKLGHNKTSDGKAGKSLYSVCSEETRKKISAAKKGRAPSQETRRKMSLAKLGKKQSPELIAKRAAAMRGRKITEEQKAAVSKALKGVPKSDAHKNKLKAAWVRRRYNMWMLKHSSMLWAFNVEVA